MKFQGLSLYFVTLAHRNKYQFYDANTSLPEIFQYKREEKEWQPRPNQKEAIENFKNARKNGRKNLLMYAVMRFGKSFTSMMCAKEMNADLVDSILKGTPDDNRYEYWIFRDVFNVYCAPRDGKDKDMLLINDFLFR